ncbi:MAG: methyltransferase family protein [Vicinamibacterales bacterium]
MSTERSRIPHPGVPFPPPLLLVGGFLVGLALERWLWRIRPSTDGLRAPFLLAGWAAIVAGLSLAVWGLLVFFRGGTTVMPHSPARRLITSGPYRFSRNPMYVGLSAVYVGLSLVFDLTWPIVLFPLALLALYGLVVRRDERDLADAFGATYTQYSRRVRRWL